MFIRIKKVAKFHYAYLVKNKWTKVGSRQVVVKYLGRVHILNRIVDKEFIDNSSDFNVILNNLAIWELERHGFVRVKNKLTYNKIVLDLSKNSFLGLNVFKINEGYLCSYTLKQIINAKSKDMEKKTMFSFAESFVNAGISVPKETFIKLYEQKFL